MGLNNSKKKKIIEVNNFYDSLVDFECCVCFNDRKCKIKRILCAHQICEKCYLKLKSPKLCPLCREIIEPIDDNNNKRICYVDNPYQENFDMSKREILEQINLNKIQKEDVILVHKHIGKVAVLGLLNDNSVLVYFMPYFYHKYSEIIENPSGENKILLFTLLEDLKQDSYDIWFNNEHVYKEIKSIIDTIPV